MEGTTIKYDVGEHTTNGDQHDERCTYRSRCYRTARKVLSRLHISLDVRLALRRCRICLGGEVVLELIYSDLRRRSLELQESHQ